MKLLSFVNQGRETWGAVVGDGVVDLGKKYPQYASLADYIASGAYLNAAKDVQGLSADAKLSDITYLPVIPRPEKSFAPCAITWTIIRKCWLRACTASCPRSLPFSCGSGVRRLPTTSRSSVPVSLNHSTGKANWPSLLAREGATSQKPRPSSMWRAILATTMAAFVSGNSMPSRLPRARTSSPRADSAPGW